MLTGVADAFPFVADLFGAAAGVVFAGGTSGLQSGIAPRSVRLGDALFDGRRGSDLGGFRLLVGLLGQGGFGAAELDVEEAAEGQDGQDGREAENGDEQLSHD